MNETREHYVEILHEFGIRQVTAEEDEDRGFDVPVDLPYIFPGLTKYRIEFLRNRSIIEKKYFLSHKLIRNIVFKTKILQNLMLDFRKYRTKGFLELTR